MFSRFYDLNIHPSILSTSRTTFFNKLSDIWYWLSIPVHCQIFKQEKWICLWPLSLGKRRNFSMGNLFFSYCDSIAGTISQKAELFLNAMAWKRISLRGAKFSHDCLFVHQCSLAELPISNFTMLLATMPWSLGRVAFALGCDEHFNLNADRMSEIRKTKQIILLTRSNSHF